MIRVCCFVCSIALSQLLAGPVWAQEAPSGGQDASDLAIIEQFELRLAGFELQAPVAELTAEDVLIFAPLAPVAVEAEPVKLPPDQQPE